MDDGCYGFKNGKQLVASSSHQLNCSLNPNVEH